MFSVLSEFIDNKFVAGNEDKELIKVNMRVSKSKFYDPEAFKNANFNYIIDKLNRNELTTDPSNNLQVIKAYNVIYNDGDWTFPRDFDNTKYGEQAEALMSLYTEQWIEELQLNNFNDFYTFQFIPTTFPNRKGGFHSFIYVSENVTIEKRLEMYNSIKRKLIDSDDFNALIPMFTFERGADPETAIRSNTFYEKLFDPSPLKSCQCLIPFAQKDATSRRYKLVDTTFNTSDVPYYFVIPVQHKEYMEINNEEITTNETKVYDDNNEELDDLLNKIKQDNKESFGDLGRVGKITAKFMLSLRYLSPNHVFWTKLADHDTKLKQITRDLIGFILINYFIEKNGRQPKNDRGQFFEAIARILHPLLRMTTINNNDTTTERDKFASLYHNIRDYYSKYTDLKNNDEDGLYSDRNVAFWKMYVGLSARKKKELELDERDALNSIKYYFQKYFGNWFKFLTETLLAGMTDEIRPFKEVFSSLEDARENVVFDDVMREQPNVNNKANLDDSFYIKTLRCWCRMFIIEGIYDTKSIQETIRSILSAFCRYYIWYSKPIQGNARIFIYNIRQTKSLCQYPYNQWITDSQDGDLLKDWIKTLYLAIIKPELLTINLPSGIKPILENLRIAELVDGGCWERMIKPLNNFDKDMDTAYKNIISSFAQERFDPPEELNTVSSPWFPMRNGLLRFLNNGEVRMSYNNHNHFMCAYTNVVWDDNYNYDCEEYKRVKLMWEQIFPDKKERDYNLSLFASSLNGEILKDALVIQVGNGADGKTVSNNAIMCMLGSEGLNAFARLEENGKSNFVLNPAGLGTTMKTEALLTSNASGHDSGREIMLNNKRFCTVQEPDTRVSNNKLNCSKVKEILSGTTITAREIHKKAECFQPNAVLTMQTNIPPGYTEDTEGLRRRVCVVYYRSQFVSELQRGERYKNLEFQFKAEPELSRKLESDPKYWQAIFYSLLPYAKDLAKRRILSLSNIPRPKTISRETMASFIKSNGIVGWLLNNVSEYPGHVMTVEDLRARIEEADRQSINARDGSLFDLPPKSTMSAKNDAIYKQINQTYLGRIYKLRKDKYRIKKRTDNDYTPDVKPEDINENESIPEMKIDERDDWIISNYFEPKAVKNFNSSKNNKFLDLFIVGVRFSSEIPEDDDEDKDSTGLNTDDENNETETNETETTDTNETNETDEVGGVSDAGEFVD